MGVFESLVKKVLDLDHTRGIVMGATSDIDHMVNECLLAIHGKLEGDAKQALLKEAMGYVQKRIDDLTKLAAELEAATTLAEFFKAHMILTSFDRLRMLAGALKAEAFKGHAAYREKVVTYQQKVKCLGRNHLGHVVLVPEGKPTEVTDIEGKVVTLDEMRELRKLILGLRGDFRGLLAALTGGAA